MIDFDQAKNPDTTRAGNSNAFRSTKPVGLQRKNQNNAISDSNSSTDWDSSLSGDNNNLKANEDVAKMKDDINNANSKIRHQMQLNDSFKLQKIDGVIGTGKNDKRADARLLATSMGMPIATTNDAKQSLGNEPPPRPSHKRSTTLNVRAMQFDCNENATGCNEFEDGRLIAGISRNNKAATTSFNANLIKADKDKSVNESNVNSNLQFNNATTTTTTNAISNANAFEHDEHKVASATADKLKQTTPFKQQEEDKFYEKQKGIWQRELAKEAREPNAIANTKTITSAKEEVEAELSKGKGHIEVALQATKSPLIPINSERNNKEKTNKYGWRRNIANDDKSCNLNLSDTKVNNRYNGNNSFTIGSVSNKQTNVASEKKQQQQQQVDINKQDKSIKTITTTNSANINNDKDKQFQFNSDLPEPSKLQNLSLLNENNNNNNNNNIKDRNQDSIATKIPISSAKLQAKKPQAIGDDKHDDNLSSNLTQTTASINNFLDERAEICEKPTMDSVPNRVDDDYDHDDNQVQDDQDNEKREAEERDRQNRLSVYENAPITRGNCISPLSIASNHNANCSTSLPTTTIGHNKQSSTAHDTKCLRPKPPAKPASLAKQAQKIPENFEQDLATLDFDKKSADFVVVEDDDDLDVNSTPLIEGVNKPQATRANLIKARTSIIQEPEDELMIAATSQSRPIAMFSMVQSKSASHAKNDNNQNDISRTSNMVISNNNNDNDGSFDDEFGSDNLQFDDDTDSSLAAPINLNSRQKLIKRFDKQQCQQIPPNPPPKPTRFSSKTPPLTRTILHQEPLPQPIVPKDKQQPGPSGSLVKRLAMNFDKVAQDNAPRSNIPPPTASMTSGNVIGNLSKQPIKSIDREQPYKQLQRQFSNQDDDPKSESTWYDARSAADTDLDEAEVAEFLRNFDQNQSQQQQQQTNQFDLPDNNTPTCFGLMNTMSSVSISTGADPYVTVGEDNTADNTNDDFDDNDDTLNDGLSVCDDNLINSNNETQGTSGNNNDDFPDEIPDKGNNNNNMNDINHVFSPNPRLSNTTALLIPQRKNNYIQIACRSKNNNEPAEKTDHSTSLVHADKTNLTDKNINLSKLLSQSFDTLQNFDNIHYHVNNDNNNTMYSQSNQKQTTPSSQLGSPRRATLKPEYFETPKQRLPLSNQNSGNDDGNITPSSYIEHHTFNSSSSSPTESLTSSLEDSFGDYRTPGLDLRQDSKLDLSRDSIKLIKTARKFSDLYNELENILAKRVANKWRSASRHKPSQKSATNETQSPKITDSDHDIDKNTDQRDSETNAPELIVNLIDLDSDNNQEMNKDKEETSNLKILQTLSNHEQIQNSCDSNEFNDDGTVASANMAETISINNVDDEEYDETLSTTTEHDDQLSLSSSNEVSTELLNEFRQRKNLQKLYHIVNEIYSSEAKFVDTLVLLNVDFRNFMQTQKTYTSTCNLSVHQHCKLLNPTYPQECINSILKHLPQLQALNENLLEELRIARQEWPDTQKIAHVLVKMGPFLKHYSTYIRDYENIRRQFIDHMKKYQQFADRVLEFEASDRCQKLTIQHHLLKPIQRLPQYRLLLQQYLHHLSKDDVDYEDTVKALEVVSQVAEHANQSMNEDAKFAKLLAIQGRIINKRIDIVKPSRVFVKEGELLKVCRKHIQPRWFVLLNDAILYLTQVPSSDIFYFNKELSLDDCQVTIQEQQTNDTKQQNNLTVPNSIQQQQQQSVQPDINYTDLPIQTGKLKNKKKNLKQKLSPSPHLEFCLFTKTRSFTLIAKSIEERDNWVAAFKKTIDEYNVRRKSFTIKPVLKSPVKRSTPTVDTSFMTPIQQAQATLDTALNDNDDVDRKLHDIKSVSTVENFTLGKKAPLWTPDAKVGHCESCTRNFSALFRRHHCRACGKVICSACSSNRAPLVYLKFKSARVCDNCFDLLKANIHHYQLPPRAFKDLSGKFSQSELCRLEEHIRVMVKSQFVKHAGLLRWFVKPSS